MSAFAVSLGKTWSWARARITLAGRVSQLLADRILRSQSNAPCQFAVPTPTGLASAKSHTTWSACFPNAPSIVERFAFQRESEQFWKTSLLTAQCKTERTANRIWESQHSLGIFNTSLWKHRIASAWRCV